MCRIVFVKMEKKWKHGGVGIRSIKEEKLILCFWSLYFFFNIFFFVTFLNESHNFRVVFVFIFFFCPTPYMHAKADPEIQSFILNTYEEIYRILQVIIQIVILFKMNKKEIHIQ